jgi:hypothetical protein
MRFLFFLVGLMAVALVAIPVWIAVTSALGLAMPWLLFGLLAWGACRLMSGPRHHSHHPRQSSSLPPRWERAKVREPIRPPAPPVRRPEPLPDLPLDVQVKVEQVRRKVDVLQQQRQRFPFASEDLYVVHATGADYLPRTLDAFVGLPRAARDHPMPNGKTPLQELKDKLQLLDSKLDEIAEDLERQNLDRLLANRRFLEERFGRAPEAAR